MNHCKEGIKEFSKRDDLFYGIYLAISWYLSCFYYRLTKLEKIYRQNNTENCYRQMDLVVTLV